VDAHYLSTALLDLRVGAMSLSGGGTHFLQYAFPSDL
jgi:hypothetical protein